MKKLLAGLLLISAAQSFAQNPAVLADSLRSGFRGLSVVNEKVIWMSGRKGLVGKSTNGGEKWKWNRVKGCEDLDFRSLQAFDKKNAVVASAGTPAVIMKTANGGKSWKQSYRSDDSTMFFDGMAFWDKQHGLIFGDPVNGKMFLMESFDGGATWKEILFADRPQMEKGEASFAASGTTIRVLPGGHVWIATGGTVARVWHSRDYGHHWEVLETPMIHGQPSQGIFSVAFYDTLNGVIVGGDYANDTLKRDHVFYTEDGGKTWNAPEKPTGGYRSCVVYANQHFLCATGTSGIDFSYDGGKTWSPETIKGRIAVTKGYNTVYATGRPLVLIYFAGSKEQKFKKGKIYTEDNIFD